MKVIFSGYFYHAYLELLPVKQKAAKYETVKYGFKFNYKYSFKFNFKYSFKFNYKYSYKFNYKYILRKQLKDIKILSSIIFVIDRIITIQFTKMQIEIHGSLVTISTTSNVPTLSTQSSQAKKK